MMKYPVQVWYGVYFSGENTEQPSLPVWVYDMLAAENELGLARKLRGKQYEGIGLAWVHCQKNYGLAVAESIQNIWDGAGELTNYPADIADVWAVQIGAVLSALETGAARITWFASAGSYAIAAA